MRFNGETCGSQSIKIAGASADVINAVAGVALEMMVVRSVGWFVAGRTIGHVH